eukprot:CAMPEP_0197653148 /NCGR_PEP_ID=MMETSP1338-20131121/34881_1 /TAXON_ID=43686 ORGANISM="Pelagodinium beii, Strain RCC1491" /NCGR_SAMPLE_ID=MMETSP1338 /ASSEMBLY_ACC=CAM_ASM_000754 /LENGTH=119 /DNA_ID=CAMNT_0043228171 /DNA_START=196 /DNA_END=555 /DNA_ORIENTATION=+
MNFKSQEQSEDEDPHQRLEATYDSEDTEGAASHVKPLGYYYLMAALCSLVAICAFCAAFIARADPEAAEEPIAIQTACRADAGKAVRLCLRIVAMVCVSFAGGMTISTVQPLYFLLLAT